MKKKRFNHLNPNPVYLNNELAIRQKPKFDYRSSTLLLIAFVTCFYSRILSTFGAPQIINFVHFAAIPAASILAIAQTRTKERKQVAISQAFLLGLIILFTVNIASALLNKAGLINVILEFLLLGEPLMLMLAITCLPLTPKSIIRFRKWLVIFASSNLFLALFQRYVLNVQNYRAISGWDLIQGVFYFTGGGHVVSSSVSLSFAIYYFVSAKTRAIWVRGLVLFATIVQIIVSDTKQVFLIFFITTMLLVLLKVNDIVKIIQYITIFILGAAALYWAAFNIYENTEIIYWASNLDLVQNGLNLKLSVFPTIISYYHSSLNWLLGLGPGHTVGRLGGWMIRDYYSLLQPLGVSTSPVGADMWKVVSADPLGDKSSMWSPFFGWAGIWGDLGFLGLAAYIFIWILVWLYFCKDDMSRFIVLSVIVQGAVFTQMEEPGYMMFVCSLIGIRWHEHRAGFTQSKKIVL